jgi:hypothetical protein
MNPLIFLSYAKEDTRRVRNVYRRLRQAGLSPWMDRPPPPWNREGIPPGAQWDDVIRDKMATARVILLFLSKASIKKQGYVQREFRLALGIAMECPVNTISIIPVLLEPCEPPDIRVDTVSLRQLQWHNLQESGLASLVDHVATIIRGWMRQSEANIEYESPLKITIDLEPLRKLASSMEVVTRGEERQPVSPSAIIGPALTHLSTSRVRFAWSERLGLDVKRVEVDLRAATSALHGLGDPYVAMIAAAMVADCVRYRTSDHTVRKELRSWLDHPVKEVAAIAVLLLARGSGTGTKVLTLLATFSEKSDRAPIFYAIVRSFFSYELLLPLARSAPLLLWGLLANDTHFGGMGQRHIPMRDAGRKFAFLTNHPRWEARETGAAIVSADEKVPSKNKLPLLSDIEPRVRFRALEGILQTTNSDPDVGPIIDMLLSNPSAQNQGRLWQVKEQAELPRLLTVSLEDANMTPPTFATGGFGRGHIFDVWECIDHPHLAMTGFMTISQRDTQLDYEDNEKRYKSRIKEVRPTWTQKFVLE